jgi:UDP-N-acetylmuramyl pentapeptide synthase
VAQFFIGSRLQYHSKSKSYNSQDVPLSVVAINEKHNLGIFEAGISTRGEMQI